MGNITFVFFTLNEEKRIGYCIRNCIKFGQVLILDDGSTDKTRVIAEQLGARVVVRPKVEYAYGENPVFFDVVKKNINTDWVYWGYADQLLPKKLLEKLAEISGQDKIKRVFVPIYTYLWGNTQYPVSKGYTPNFFHTKYMDFSTNKIHGMGKFLGIKQEEFKLPNLEDFAIRHFSVYDLKKFIMNHMAYAETEARQKYEDGEKFSLYRLLGGMTR